MPRAFTVRPGISCLRVVDSFKGLLHSSSSPYSTMTSESGKLVLMLGLSDLYLVGLGDRVIYSIADFLSLFLKRFEDTED